MPSRKSTISGGYDDIYGSSEMNSHRMTRSRSLTRRSSRVNKKSRSRSRSRASKNAAIPLESRQPSFTFRGGGSTKPQTLTRRR